METSLIEADAEQGSETEAPTAQMVEPDAIPAVFGTSDHRYLGKLWMGAGLVFGLFSLVSAVLLSFQQRGSELLGSVDSHTALFSTYRVGVVFLFLVPLFLGLAIHIVPSQIGAKSLVFPRAGLGAFWTWLIGSGMFLTSWAIDGGLAPGGDQEAVELTLLALGLIVVSILAATISLIATIVVSRIQNMTLWQVPMFTWSMLVAGGVWLLTLPVLFGNIITAWVDLRGAGAVHYGLANNLYSQIDWVFDQPQVFIFALPLLGIFSDIAIATMNKRTRHYEIFQILIVAAGVLSFGAYAQEFFAPNVSETPVFVVGSLLMLLVLLIFIGGWLNFVKSHMSSFSPKKINAPITIITFSLLTFLTGAVIAALRVMGDFLNFLSNFATDNEDYQSGLADFLDPLLDLKGSVIASSVLHLVISAGFLAILAGIYYWAPKLLGRELAAIKGIGIGLLGFGGAMLWALGDIINGFLEQPEIPSEFADFQITDGMMAASILTILGAILVGLAVLGLVFELIQASVSAKTGPSNPLGAGTLEWTELDDARLDDKELGDKELEVKNAYPLWPALENLGVRQEQPESEPEPESEPAQAIEAPPDENTGEENTEPESEPALS